MHLYCGAGFAAYRHCILHSQPRIGSVERRADTSWYDSEVDDFTLYTAEELAGLAELVNSGIDFSGKTVHLGTDIVLNDTSDWENWGTNPPENSWTPIGNADVYTEPTIFNGSFSGQGHTVSGMYTATFSTEGMTPGTHTLTITFRQQQFDVMDWVDTDITSTMSIEFTVAEV